MCDKWLCLILCMMFLPRSILSHRILLPTSCSPTFPFPAHTYIYIYTSISLDLDLDPSLHHHYLHVDRLAGLMILKSLVDRVGPSVPRNIDIAQSSQSTKGRNGQLILEALLPHKEEMLRMSRTCLSDPEAKVTAVATDVCGSMGWWP